MKKFVSENWYKLMIGSSLLMASFGFMVYSVSPAMADNGREKMNANSNYKMVCILLEYYWKMVQFIQKK